MKTAYNFPAAEKANLDKCKSGRLYTAARYLYSHCLDQLYYCGLPLSLVAWRGTFGRLAPYIGHGICYEAAALMMIALKDNQTARLVYGLCKSHPEGHRTLHAWVEFRYRGKWYVADACWLSVGMMPRWWYYQDAANGPMPEPQKIISYQEFWQLKVAEQLYQKLKDPASSNVMIELSLCFRPPHDRLETGKTFLNPEPKLTSSAGRTFLPVLYEKQKAVLTKEIIREFTLKRERKSPRQRTRRRALKAAYEEYEKLGLLEADRTTFRGLPQLVI